MIDARAYVLREQGVVPTFEKIQVNEELSIGQVLVRVLYSSLCATQIEEIFAASRNKGHMPHLFGHEGVGVIEKVGPAVKNRKVGEVCVLHWRKSSIGLDAEPGSYFSETGPTNAGKIVTFSSIAVVPENRLTPLPNNFPLEAGSLLGCALTTGWGSVLKVGEFKPNDEVLVVGLGAVGSFAALTARLMGAKDVIGIDPKSSTLDRAHAIGLSQHFSSLLDWKESPAGGKQNLIIETSGDTQVISSIIQNSPSSARVVLVGMPKNGELASVDVQRLLDGLQLRGSNGGSVDPANDIETVAHLFQEVVRDPKLGIAKWYGEDELSQAVAGFRNSTSLRSILSIGSLTNQ